MGNQESSTHGIEGASTVKRTRDPADILRNQLVQIEQAIQNIEASHTATLSELTSTRPSVGTNSTRIFGISVECCSDTSVLVGPLLGRVTSTQAVVLVEVDQDGPISVCLSRTDQPGAPPPSGREVLRVVKTLKARVPFAFEVGPLEPAARYAVVLNGVNKADTERCVAHFWTMDPSFNGFRLLLFGADHPGGVRSGEVNLWDTAAERLEAFSPIGMASLPGSVQYDEADLSLRPQLSMHLGGITRMKEAFEEAWAILKTHAERADLKPGDWQEAEDKATERIREVYRFSWNLEGKRKVMMGVGGLAVCSDRDVYPDFHLHPEITGEKRHGVAACLLRICRKVYFEYAHQLNGATQVGGSDEGSWRGNQNNLVDLTYRSIELQRKSKALNLNLLKAKRALKELTDGDPKLVEEGELASAEKRVLSLELAVESSEAEEEEVQSQLGRIQDTHERQLYAFHLFPTMSEGTIGVLMLDTIWTRCRADGLLNPYSPIVTDVQLDSLEIILEEEPLRQLVIVMSTPITPVQTRHSDEQPQEGEDGERFLPSDPWLHSGPQKDRMLEILFEWLLRERWREVLIFSGGSGCALETDIYDQETKGTIRQITVGPMTEKPMEFKAALTGWIGASQRFTYKHKPYKENGRACLRTYCEGALIAQQDAKSQSQFAFQGELFPGIYGVVGPIVGRVTHASAIILLEVDHTAAVTCVVCETLSGAEYRQTRRLVRFTPLAFYLTGLQPGRDYTIHFEGIEDSARRVGGFTTLRRNAPEFRVAFLSHPGPKPLELASEYSPSGFQFGLGPQTDKIDGIEILTKVASTPWGAIDVFVHLGNQVCLDGVMDEVRSLLVRAETAVGSSQEVLEKAARDRVRDGYRTWWSLPHLRELFAYQSHVMIYGEGEVGGMYLKDDPRYTKSVYVNTTLRRVVKEAFQDYQRQLWQPSDFGRRTDLQGDWQHLYLGLENKIALFALDLKDKFTNTKTGFDEEECLISEEQWKALARLLSKQSVQVLLIASEFPLVDDSISDAIFKAGSVTDAHLKSRWPYNGSELLRLLTALIRWKSHVPGRNVTFVGGNVNVGFESLINHIPLKTELPQIVTGPLISQVDPFMYELTGKLSDDINYQHTRILTQRNFLVLRVQKEPNTASLTVKSKLHEYNAIAEESNWDLNERERHVPEWASKMIRMQFQLMQEELSSSKESKDVSLIDNSTNCIKEFFRQDSTINSFRRIYEHLECRGNSLFSNFEDFAQETASQLHDFFYRGSSEEILEWTIPPSQLVIEMLAQLHFSVGKSADKTSRILELLDFPKFLDFCVECFLVATKVKKLLS